MRIAQLGAGCSVWCGYRGRRRLHRLQWLQSGSLWVDRSAAGDTRCYRLYRDGGRVEISAVERNPKMCSDRRVAVGVYRYLRNMDRLVDNGGVL